MKQHTMLRSEAIGHILQNDMTKDCPICKQKTINAWWFGFIIGLIVQTIVTFTVFMFKQ